MIAPPTLRTVMLAWRVGRVSPITAMIRSLRRMWSPRIQSDSLPAGGAAAPVAAACPSAAASSNSGVIVTISAAGAGAIGSHPAENNSDRTIDGDRRRIGGDSGGIWGPAGPQILSPPVGSRGAFIKASQGFQPNRWPLRWRRHRDRRHCGTSNPPPLKQPQRPQHEGQNTRDAARVDFGHARDERSGTDPIGIDSHHPVIDDGVAGR